MSRSLILFALSLGAVSMSADAMAQDAPQFGNLQYTQAALADENTSTFSGSVTCADDGGNFRIQLMPPPNENAGDKDKPEDAPEGGAPGLSMITAAAVNADGSFEILVPAGRDAVLMAYQDNHGNNQQDPDELMLIANSGQSVSTTADKSFDLNCGTDRVGGPMGDESGDDATPK
jgi:hypothetical protein